MSQWLVAVNLLDGLAEGTGQSESGGTCTQDKDRWVICDVHASLPISCRAVLCLIEGLGCDPLD